MSRLQLITTGGNHDDYQTDGTFDRAKWTAALDRMASETRQAVAEELRRGRFVGDDVMDEPQP